MRTMQRAGRPPWGRLLAGLLLSSGIALLARRRKALSRSGVPAAIVSGTTVFGLGGPDWGLGLIFFFVSSSLLSRLRAGEKERTVGEKFSKGAERDLLQVMANGGVATLCALGSALADAESQGTAGQDLWQAAFSGALATATADTWATEIGVLATQPPRLITSGRRVARGTSGGITSLGTLAAAAGALATGLVVQGTRTLLRRGAGSEPASSTAPAAARRLALPLAPIALLSGLGGSLLDSLLGATVQALYCCPRCGGETEQRLHRCGTRTVRLRGLPWMNNDSVNLLATLGGGLLALSMAALWRLYASASASVLKNGRR